MANFTHRVDLARVLFLLVVAVLTFVVIHFRLYEYISIDFLQQQREAVATFYQENTLISWCGLFILYVLFTGLSIPSATALTLFVGAICGLGSGFLLVALASTIGATIAFSIARFLFRDFIQRRFAKQIGVINRGVEKEGVFYLFALRLAPFMPYFILNLVAALTPLRLRTYYWVTQIGVLPGALVCVNAGQELGSIESLGDIWSPSVVLAMLALGTFPLLMRVCIQLYRNAIVKRN